MGFAQGPGACDLIPFPTKICANEYYVEMAGVVSRVARCQTWKSTINSFAATPEQIRIRI
jgi:hypothetical protein